MTDRLGPLLLSEKVQSQCFFFFLFFLQQSHKILFYFIFLKEWNFIYKESENKVQFRGSGDMSWSGIA